MQSIKSFIFIRIMRCDTEALNILDMDKKSKKFTRYGWINLINDLQHGKYCIEDASGIKIADTQVLCSKAKISR